MHAPVTKTVTLPHSAEAVYAAVVKTVEHGKYSMAAAEPAMLRTAFSSGKTSQGPDGQVEARQVCEQDPRGDPSKPGLRPG